MIREDLATVINLTARENIVYWLDGGWGVDVLAGKQPRVHRNIDIDFDTLHKEKLLSILITQGYEIETDPRPARKE